MLEKSVRYVAVPEGSELTEVEKSFLQEGAQID